MSRRARKIDTNQPAIVRDLRTVPGITVAVSSMMGDGFPDICVGYNEKTWLFEIKKPGPPSAQKLTPDEEAWHAKWTGHVAIVTTATECLLEMGFSPQSIRELLVPKAKAK